MENIIIQLAKIICPFKINRMKNSPIYIIFSLLLSVIFQAESYAEKSDIRSSISGKKLAEIQKPNILFIMISAAGNVSIGTDIKLDGKSGALGVYSGFGGPGGWGSGRGFFKNVRREQCGIMDR